MQLLFLSALTPVRLPDQFGNSQQPMRDVIDFSASLNPPFDVEYSTFQLAAFQLVLLLIV